MQIDGRDCIEITSQPSFRKDTSGDKKTQSEKLLQALRCQDGREGIEHVHQGNKALALRYSPD